jgi:hypothetical protein
LDLQHTTSSVTVGADFGTIRRMYLRSGTVTQTAGTVFIADTGSNSYISDGGAATYAISGGSFGTAGELDIGSAGVLSVIGSSATVSVGNGAGDNLVLTSGAGLSFTLDGAGVSTLTVVDGLTVDAVSLLTVDGTGYTGGFGNITLVNAASMTGSFASGNYTVTGLGDEGTDWSLTQGTNGDVVLNVIPEPATLGLIASFGGGILFIRRRFQI